MLSERGCPIAPCTCYNAQSPADDQARLPLQFLPDVKRDLDRCGIAWVELEYAEADHVIATVVHTTAAPRPVIIMSRDKGHYQLITDRVVVPNTRSHAGRKLVTPDEVYRRHQVTPAQWADFRALARDPCRRHPWGTRQRSEDRGDTAGRRPDPR